MINFFETHWRLPVKPGQMGGFRSRLVTVPGTTTVILSLPSGGPASPWCVMDLMDGHARRGTGMPGDLRAAVFGDPAAADSRPWALGTFGPCRLRFDPMPQIEDVVRKGIGKYRAVLLDIDDELLGVGHSRGGSLLLVSKIDGLSHKRVRIPGGELAYPLPGGRLRVFGFRHGSACDFDLRTRRVSSRHRVHPGQGPLRVGDQVVVLTGQVRPVRITDGQSQVEPGEPLVYLAAAFPPDAPPPDLGSWLRVERICVLDSMTLEVRRSAPIRPDAVEILGTDSAGRIVVATRRGFILLEPQTLATLATHERDSEISGATFCPGYDVVGITVNDIDLYAIRW